MTDFSSASSYRGDIDGLRGLAVLSVVVYHIAPKGLMGGYVGVDVFFVISGYLISSLILRGLVGDRFSFAGFYLARVRRIFPALILVLAATCLAGWLLLYPDEFRTLGKHILGGTLSFENLILWGESGYFDKVATLKPLLHLWSLGIEEQFYIVFPLSIYILYKISKSTLKSPIKILGLFFLIVFVFSLTVNFIIDSEEAKFYCPITRAWELLAGVLISIVAVLGGSGVSDYLGKTKGWLTTPIKGRNWRPIEAVMAFIGMALVLTAVTVAADSQEYPIWRNYFAVLGTGLLIASGQANPVNGLLFGNKGMRYLGLISYPLYLWHWPMVAFANVMTFGTRHSDLTRLVFLVSSIALASLTYHLAEKPIRFSPGRRKAKHVSLILSMGLLAVVGLSIWMGAWPKARTETAGYSPEVFETFANSIKTSDRECLNGLGFTPYRNIFCRVKNVGSSKTMLILGDSHGISVFPGLSELNAQRGVNTLMLGTETQIRPMLGSDRMVRPRELNEWRDLMKRYYAFIENDPKIETVLLVLRFSQETASLKKLPPDPVTDPEGQVTALDLYMESLQKTVDFLNNAGKKVFILADWPGLELDPRNYLARPFKGSAPLPSREEALKHYDGYLDRLDRINGATIIRTDQAFCPADKCFVLSEEKLPLYSNTHHLTQAGSDFVASKVLADYFGPGPRR